MRSEIILREGYIYIITSLSVFIISILFKFNPLIQLILFSIFIFFVIFFRNPDRIPTDPKAIISPSDGEIIDISEAISPLTNKNSIKISIRLGLFDVHVQRAPIEGEIVAKEKIHGLFLYLSNEKSSELNEQNRVLFKNADKEIVVVQIAGFITRRIVDFVGLGKIKLAQRYGMIIFGSQVDVYLPLNTNLKVEINDRVKAGESCLGYFNED